MEYRGEARSFSGVKGLLYREVVVGRVSMDVEELPVMIRARLEDIE